MGGTKTCLKDGRVYLNDRGTLMELVERLYFHRGHLLSIFNLDPLEVYPSATRTAHAEVEDIECEVFKSKSYSSENPIILCDRASTVNRSVDTT